MRRCAARFRVKVDVKLLTRDEYLATMDAPTRLVEANDDSFEPVAIGDYVEACIDALGLPTSRADIEVHYVYANPRRPLVHVLLSWGEPDKYLVVVTDTEQRTVVGHRVLDMREEYGLSD